MTTTLNPYLTMDEQAQLDKLGGSGGFEARKKVRPMSDAEYERRLIKGI